LYPRLPATPNEPTREKGKPEITGKAGKMRGSAFPIMLAVVFGVMNGMTS
jgi:hypothetical protein